MQIQSKFNQLSNKSNLITIIKAALQKNSLEFNCMRIGIIKAFYPEDLTVDVLIANKKTIGLNADGTQITQDYALIRAKICYCNPFITFPLTQSEESLTLGEECIVLFSDREIESWFINGDVNPEGYPRMHDLTDAVAIVGIRSLPKMINILADCLNLFYGQSNIALSEDHINITSPTVQISNLQAMNGASGNIVDSNGKILAKVEYGIITEIY